MYSNGGISPSIYILWSKRLSCIFSQISFEIYFYHIWNKRGSKLLYPSVFARCNMAGLDQLEKRLPTTNLFPMKTNILFCTIRKDSNLEITPISISQLGSSARDIARSSWRTDFMQYGKLSFRGIFFQIHCSQALLALAHELRSGSFWLALDETFADPLPSVR